MAEEKHSHSHHDKHEAHRQLVARLRRQVEDVRRLTQGLAEEAAAKQPEPGKWSVKELVCHLHRVQEVFEARVDALLTQDNPAIVRYDPDGDAEFSRMRTAPADGLVARFLEGRERFAARLEALAPAEWHRKGRHPEFPHYDVHFQVEYMAHHEAHHIYQMFQRRIPLGKMPH